jgi:3-hydroxyisobutyrate dehydrogenase-like beta-hydroxyacid dehydrogenase
MTKTAFIGLGVMGYPMAGHLHAQGHEVSVYNRTAAKAEKWAAEHGGRVGQTPAEAARGAEIVFCCVGNDDDLRSVTIGSDGAFSTMQSGAIFVDHTTASAEVARELSAVAEKSEIGFVDAPVSGGQAGAKNGVLTVMCGGSPEDYAQVEKAILCFAQASRLMGPVGAGQLTKMVNQICIAGLVQGLAEGLAFAQKAGLDGKAVVDVISWPTAATQCWMMNSNSALLSTGCARIWVFVWKRRPATGPSWKSRNWWTATTVRFRIWVVVVGTRLALCAV